MTNSLGKFEAAVPEHHGHTYRGPRAVSLQGLTTHPHGQQGARFVVPGVQELTFRRQQAGHQHTYAWLD
jgi:hypothetical protein